MKVYLTLFGIACATIACATPDTKRDIAGFSYTADKRLSHYVTEFLADCGNYLSESVCKPRIDLTVTVSKLPDNILGQCSVYEGRLRAIQLDDIVLNQYNEKAVIYHELYHCVLGRPHFDDELDIMNTYEVDENTVRMYENWSEYTKKVFTRE